MLKQSLVQEKLSDLAVVTADSGKSGGISPTKSEKIIKSKSAVSAISGVSSNGDSLLPHVPQWPRVQIGTQQIQSNIKRSAFSNYSNARAYTNASSPSSAVNLNTNYAFRNEENNDGNDLNEDNNDSIEYDGIETVNYYSNNHSFGKPPNNNNNFNSNSFSYGNTSNSNNPNNFSNSNNNSSLNKNNANSINVNSLNNNNSKTDSDSNNNNNSTSDSYDPTMKLRYLEKSIKFIQQQHTETLSSLHQEIEKLKNENRGIYIASGLKVKCVK
jgi:hypothetical protein